MPPTIRSKRKENDGQNKGPTRTLVGGGGYSPTLTSGLCCGNGRLGVSYYACYVGERERERVMQRQTLLCQHFFPLISLSIIMVTSACAKVGTTRFFTVGFFKAFFFFFRKLNHLRSSKIQFYSVLLQIS